jgi:hypothetical protein
MLHWYFGFCIYIYIYMDYEGREATRENEPPSILHGNLLTQVFKIIILKDSLYQRTSL